MDSNLYDQIASSELHENNYFQDQNHTIEELTKEYNKLN